MKSLICIILLVLLSAESALAATVTLQARRHAVVMGDRIVLQATIDAEGELQKLIVPDGTRVTQGGSQSQVNITNGRMARSETTTFHVSVTQPGAYVLGPAIAIVDGKTLQSNRVKVIVQPPGQDRVLQVRAIAKPVRVYEGEPFQLITKIAYGSHYQPTGWTPPSNGAVQTHPGQKQAHQTQELVPLRDMQIPELQIRNWMIPVRAGNYALSGGYVELETTTRTKPRRTDPFGLFGTSRPGVQQPIPATTLQVTPLPAPPTDSTFSGLVGAYQLQWRQQDATDERIRGVITLRGVGSALAPHLESWTHRGWTVYPDVPEVSYAQDTDGVPQTTVQIPLTLVAGAADPTPLPHWFDTGTGRYVAIQVPVDPAPEPKPAPTGSRGMPGQLAQAGSTNGEPCELDPVDVFPAEVPLDIRYSKPWVASATWGLWLQLLLLPVGIWLRRSFRKRLPATSALVAAAMKSDNPAAWQEAWQKLSVRTEDPVAVQLAETIAFHIFRAEYASPREAVQAILEAV